MPWLPEVHALEARFGALCDAAAQTAQRPQPAAARTQIRINARGFSPSQGEVDLRT